MTIERPTFSDSWHRIADVRCRVRTGVQFVRQRYRGQVWHVLQDPSANQYFRLNKAAYALIGLLDGRRTVREAWTLACDQWGDLSPTQGEVVQLLAQLYTSNLLAGELPGDALAVLKRRQSRISREIKGQLSNLLFLRIPLLDPDPWLSRWKPMVSWIFSPLGIVAWLLVVALGAAHLLGRGDELQSRLSGVLAADNLLYLYVVFVAIKLIHELGHAFACKCLGAKENAERADSGAVRSMGIMLMVLMPVPYVDASSSWVFRSKAHRVIVAAAGMLAELFVAGIAAIIWARTAEGGLVHALAYNALITASVSTVLLNGNPLLRYDGYFILSELIDLPNLAQRSTNYLQYLVKRYVWRVPRAQSPATSRGERIWFMIYGPASFVYRMIVLATIIVFVAQQWFIIGVAFAVFGLIAWMVLPLARFVRYLFTGPELARVRSRALITTAGAFAALVAAIGFVPFPDHVRANGVVEPLNLAIVHSEADGFVITALASGNTVQPGKSVLLESESPLLLARERELLATKQRLAVAYQKSLADEPANAQQFKVQLEAVEDQLRFVRRDLDGLRVGPSQSGAWVSPEDESLKGRYLKRGTPIGMVANMDRLIVRAVATQEVAARLVQYRPDRAEIRVQGRASHLFEGTVREPRPAGQNNLPSRALGFNAGGSVLTDPSDDKGERSKQEFFEVILDLDPGTPVLPGQRVVARFSLQSRPLAIQAWHAFSQLLQRRFRI